MTRIPKEFREDAYISKEGLAAWTSERAVELVAWLEANGLAPSVAEAWMVFTQGAFAGTHTTVIHEDAETSSMHRWQLGEDYAAWTESWGAYRARAAQEATTFIRAAAADSAVDSRYRDTIRYHLQWRGEVEEVE